MPEPSRMTGRKEKTSADGLRINPEAARLDISSRCQLHCLLCPVGHRKGRPFIGRRVMPAGRFIEFIDENPQIRAIEIGNSGEVFLNPELPAMLKYAHDRGVIITIKQGSNLNDASDEALEALVKYRVALLKVSIDGATQETYQTYRVGGSLRKVLSNVQKINEYKKQNRSGLPRLILQFIPFEHNEHEISQIALMARALGMELFIKLNVFKEFLSVRDHAALTRLIGFHDTDSFLEKTGKIYMRNICLELWKSPQIGCDGRLLGCSHNVWGLFADDALGGGFTEVINNERMQYARKMLMNAAPARADIPCSACEVYADFQRNDQWFSPEEIRTAMEQSQTNNFNIDEE